MLLNAQEPQLLRDYLVRRGWIDESESITTLEKPGEGNMNYILRISTPIRSLIVKQARGYVEKYPTIVAPAERAIIEGHFYEAVQDVPMLAEQMPHLLGLDPENNILVLEDLGRARDYTNLYQPGQLLGDDEQVVLTEYLANLHHHFAVVTPTPVLRNKAMRALNHEHLFVYPFQIDNRFDLDTVQPGLQELAMSYKTDSALKTAIQRLGDVYLADGPTLLHGDYYPGSWLRTDAGPKIIDPECCFYGPPEYDLGVFVAHLQLANQPESTRKRVLTVYRETASFDEKLCQQFSAVEIMRRLIGLAPLPLPLSLDQKAQLLTDARKAFV
ncbi:5-methylthioribose kinase [Spirosoma oryzae]|uniref:5-methylthioribose kinase n=1 Tax=Spirosoma oryzae TaxID=1469603 RepID=A0A2T0SSY5_9BACT|nr:phosphotransferase [Spirosoma oryzae]PRY36525.1 5-methylthioribose kinase [Spirosoma oryzae]